MATQSVKTRGSQWSDSELYDGWGNEATDEQIVEAGEGVVEEFQRIARANGANVIWQPSTGEVIGDYEQELDEDLLEEWREQATETVWNRIVNS